MEITTMNQLGYALESGRPVTSMPAGNAAERVSSPVSPAPLPDANTLYQAFLARVQATPERTAYREYDGEAKRWVDTRWREMAREVARWQVALRNEALAPGDRVAVMLRNGRSWIAFDQAALGLGLAVVPLYTNDRADNVAYCLGDAGVRLLLIDGEVQWKALRGVVGQLPSLRRIVHISPLKTVGDDSTIALDAWLPAADSSGPDAGDAALAAGNADPDALASIVYTSGTTGRPKGVMLSHRNMLWDAGAVLPVIAPDPERDSFLSFLPLSHTLERTAGYYLPMITGTPVIFARSVTQLGDDLKQQRPSVIVSVPRVFELLYARVADQIALLPPLQRRLFRLAVSTGWHRFEQQQGKRGWHPSLLLWPLLKRRVADKVMQRFGGRLRVAVSGGAAISAEVAKLFIGLGLPLAQGYGLSEHSPVISVNPLEDNDPTSVGKPLPGVELRFGDNDELLVRSPAVTLGYWNNPEATRALIDPDGWLHTGDQASLRDGHLHITGRIKDILVLSNGEKVPPGDMETAITMEPLFDQAVVVGEGRPYLGALLTLNREHWVVYAQQQGLDPDDHASLQDPALHKRLLKLIATHTKGFPGYAQIRGLALIAAPWTVEDGLLTPTLKLRRSRILERHRDELDAIYAGRRK